MLYRYRAIPLAEGGGSDRRGLLSASSAADVRASLRRIGLLALEVRPARARSVTATRWASVLRARRRRAKIDLLDALASMLGAGIPLEESLSTLGRAPGATSAMIATVRHEVREGSPLSVAMDQRPAWFDPADVALVRCGELSGDLSAALRAACERDARLEALESKLVQALTYPVLVGVVAIGVTVFLSTHTLPQLCAILTDSDVPVPGLTLAVMRIGSALASYGWLLVVAILVLIGAVGWISRGPDSMREGVARRPWKFPGGIGRPAREACLADALFTLAHLVRVGIPLVEALRASSASLRGVSASRVGSAMRIAADRIETGAAVARSLREAGVIDDELVGVVSAGEAAGELDSVLAKAADRLARRSRRATERLAALLEPGSILLLAVLVGLVVMAAVLPLLRMKEIV
ncbi:MAG: type II secretion system F family protein [Phycisphaeraceae bacterium]|nr:type II secretion system F family protein [Phycisphaeraceae bacterium]